MLRRIHLNPSDLLFYVLDRVMARFGEGGYVGAMEIELEGAVDPDEMRDVLEALLLAHPVLMARLRRSWFRRRPYYVLPRDPEAVAKKMVEKVYTLVDLRGSSNPVGEFERLGRGELLRTWSLWQGPMVGLVHYALSPTSSRFVFRWPHLLMDAGGCMWFLGEIGRLSELPREERRAAAQDRPEGLLADDAIVDPLAGLGFLERLSLAGQGIEQEMEREKHAVKGLLERDTAPPLQNHRMVQRTWSAERVAAVRMHAREVVPPGPGIYARYLGACLLRTLHRIYTEQGVESEGYVISMPANLSSLSTEGPAPERPMEGNYLVSPALRAHRSVVEDMRALSVDIDEQVKRYYETSSARKQWALMWMLSLLPTWLYVWLASRMGHEEPLSSGFSYYGEGPDPLRSWFGHAVRNVFGFGALPTPPGWNSAFVKFRDHVSFSFVYRRPAISDELAERFMDVMEEEAFGTTIDHEADGPPEDAT